MINNAKDLIPPPSEGEIVKCLSRNFTKEIQTALIMTNTNTKEDLTKFSDALDQARLVNFSEHYSPRPNSAYNQNRYNAHQNFHQHDRNNFRSNDKYSNQDYSGKYQDKDKCEYDQRKLNFENYEPRYENNHLYKNRDYDGQDNLKIEIKTIIIRDDIRTETEVLKTERTVVLITNMDREHQGYEYENRHHWTINNRDSDYDAFANEPRNGQHNQSQGSNGSNYANTNISYNNSNGKRKNSNGTVQNGIYRRENNGYSNLGSRNRQNDLQSDQRNSHKDSGNGRASI
ncbi:GATA zinc finger domain-containing protein 14-like [Belonocnema kinseyi]|uniref:GATA zinc finger domain-containing protein 14-like n=1 Tax=Belonocnema kinseyi TaxID=2817044 RepID=UPI00143D2C08|nr:GATA zinc finger domain-containing protein 14-like [Belonocnema kinseyi]